MQPNNIITELVRLTKSVREMQQKYFRTKDPTLKSRFLSESKQLEKELDKLIEQNPAFLEYNYTQSLVSSFDHKPPIAPAAPKQAALFSNPTT